MAKKKTTEHEYTADEIVKMVDKKRDSTAYSEMFDQMDEHFDLFALKEYKPEAGHQSYTSPKPKNDFLKVFSGVNKASLTWNIALSETAPEDERNAANRGEEILTGILSQVDEDMSSNGEPPLRQGAAWFGCGRGAVGIKCLIYVDDKKEQVIDIQALDPLHMTWEKGKDSLNWGANEYVISKMEAQERYGIEITEEDGTARLIDFFTRKMNAIVLSYGTTKEKRVNEFVKKPTPHGLDHVPMWIEFSGGMPTVYNKNFEMQLKYRAADVWGSSAKIYDPFNKQVSFILDTAEKSVAGTLVYETEHGNKQIAGDPFAAWKVILTKTGEKLSALEPPKVPPESGIILGIIDKDLAQSTVPYPIGYGLDPQAHSGSALAMINDNTRSIYDPFTSLLERSFKWLCKEILIQFKNKGQKITLRGFNQHDKFFTLDANPDDIKDGWYIHVKCEPRLPRDEAAELQMALAATQPRPPFNRPLVSDYTAREKIIKIQNPDAEEKRIEEQQVRRMIEQAPQIQIRKMALEMVKKGDIEGAKEFMAMMPNPQQGQGQGQGGGQPQGGEVPQGQPMPQGGQGGMQQGQPQGAAPQITPQQLEQAAQIAAQLKAQGKPIPPQLAMILQQAANMPAPQK
jgi:hypothetical protein